MDDNDFDFKVAALQPPAESVSSTPPISERPYTFYRMLGAGWHEGGGEEDNHHFLCHSRPQNGRVWY